MADRESLIPAPRLPAFPHALAGPSPRVAVALAVLAALLGGVVLGWVASAHSPLPASAAVVALGLAVLVLSDARAAVWATLAVVALLPFATLPVHVGLTLSLFELGALSALGVWLLTMLLRRDRVAPSGLPAAAIGLFLAVTLFALILGVGRGYTMETFHNYGKFTLAVLLGYVVWNATRNLDDARRTVTVLLLAGGLAAALGLVLYAGGPGLTQRALGHLVPYGYPSGRIVRWIEDNPAKPMRLVGTSVDPNSFGGLLAVVAVLAVAQAIAARPLISRWLTWPVSGLALLASLLTFSRGAWVGIAAGLGLLAVLRYRRLVIPGALAVIPVAVLGLGSRFVHRLWLGLTLQDPATRLRLSEYRNALAIIRSHPFFGVGFGAAPSIDQQTGVSSVYLSIAERAGLIGLAVFLFAVAVVLTRAWVCWRAERETALGDLQLGLSAALASALVVGVFDHYYFNITFPHMAALFWTLGGLILALTDLGAEEPAPGAGAT